MVNVSWSIGSVNQRKVKKVCTQTRSLGVRFKTVRDGPLWNIALTFAHLCQRGNQAK